VALGLSLNPLAERMRPMGSIPCESDEIESDENYVELVSF